MGLLLALSCAAWAAVQSAEPVVGLIVILERTCNVLSGTWQMVIQGNRW